MNLLIVFLEVSAEESGVFPCSKEKFEPVVMVPTFLAFGSCRGHVLAPVVETLCEEALQCVESRDHCFIQVGGGHAIPTGYSAS